MADRETIVTSSGGGVGVVAGILLVIVIAVGLFLYFNGTFGSKTVDIDVPAVTVDVKPDGQ